uniref:MtrB/PioB family outer membrane beta-barrel protein n=1 Tax=Nevskia soli TaxID=418856 RepID=UPI0015D8E620
AAATPAAAPDTPQTTPGENWLTGSIDLGYRWQTGVGGSFDTYRSIVDLGSGPKLVGADFTITDPKHRIFDQIDVRAYNWGDDPYQTLHVDARKKKLYDLNLDYRDIAYFDFLPSYADPLLSTRGITLNEESFDTHRRMASASLDLLPGNWIVPYVAYDRDSGSGTGATAFVSDANSFPVPNSMSDRTNLYRAGVRIELRRFHVTLEEGGTTFENNQDLYQPSGSTNYGNFLNPFLGQPIYLTALMASYGITGSSTYSKGLFTANATSWLDLYGQFLYSDPNTNVNYNQYDTGNLVVTNEILFYTGQQFLLDAAAKSPHTSGSLGAEIRPFRKFRIVQSWLTDRMHDTGWANSNQILTDLGVSAPTAALLSSSLVNNYNREEIDLFYDPVPKLTLRAGYRYVWGDAGDAVLPTAGLVGAEQGKLSQNVAIVGATYRARQKLNLSGDLEVAASDGAYFRTSLYNYQKFHAQARYQASASLSVSATFLLLNNSNPLPNINYSELAAVQESLSFLWAPQGKPWNVQGSYTRAGIYSDIGYLEPETLTPERAIYRDNSHTATGLFSSRLPHYSGLIPTVTAGGSFFISSGSRPTNYYQPFAKLLVPVRNNLAWFTQWTYYGYGETFYEYEGFRSNSIMTGLRFSR